MSHLFIELRVEEIPAGMQHAAEQAFASMIAAFFTAHNITAALTSGSLTSRMYVAARDLPSHTAETTVEKRGPRTSAPQQALDGFIKGCGCTEADLTQRETDKGAFYFYTAHTPAQDLRTLLAAALPDLIKNIPWPKAMRWGNGEMTFVRPLSGIVALFDGEVIPFEIDGLKSGRATRGHFYTTPELFEVDPENYETQLEKRGVMASRPRREAEIRRQLTALADSEGLTVVPNDALVREVAGLIEWPHAVLSQVNQRFLTLPKEVLIKTMVADQRYFALADADGKLSHKFIGISNMADGKGNIAKGYAKVLTARFDDARFYWETDRKQPLAHRYDQLADIIFHKQLGSLQDKSQRIQTVVSHDVLPGGAHAVTAAKLAKCDLVTGVVYEFPDLQGIIGGYLAETDGAPGEVVTALKGQYQHDGFSADLPDAAAALIIADRLDTLTGFFGIDQKPTGSKDPYALRRAALTIIRVLIAKKWHLSLEKLVKTSANAYENTGLSGIAAPETIRAVVAFITERLSVILKEQGIPYDYVDAVLASGSDDLLDLIARARAIGSFMETEAGSDLHAAFKRAYNILAGKTADNVTSALLQEDAERQLFATVGTVTNTVTGRMSVGDYPAALATLTTLRAPLTAFYDQVQVMADDPALKQNRLALLGAVIQPFQQVADFTKLAG